MVVLTTTQILGMGDKRLHKVVGTNFAQDKVGNLEDETYTRLGIRVHITELLEEKKQVLVVDIPSRPIGRLMKFEMVALMRTGESLRKYVRR